MEHKGLKDSFPVLWGLVFKSTAKVPRITRVKPSRKELENNGISVPVTL